MFCQCEGDNYDTTKCTKATTGLLALPLVIVRIIIEEVCISLRRGGVIAD
jgi:hypothetical protein